MNDEIDVRQYLRVLWNRRRVVIAVTVTALVAAVLLSVLVLRPTYEASALVTIAGGSFPVGDIVPLVHNENVAAQVAKRLPSGQVPRPALLVRSVRMTVVGERMVRITARDVSPAGAAALAGAWAGAFEEHVEALVSRDLRQSLAALNELDERINGARRALGPPEEAWRVFQARSRVPVLAQRVEETARRIAVYESRLVEIEQGGGPIVGDVAVHPGGERFTLVVIVDRNPAKIRRVLVALKTGLPSLQAQLATERQRETQVLRRVEQARGTYERLVAKREELVILVGGTTGLVSVAVPPAVPDAPVGPRKTVIILLAAILGLLAGVVLAFVIEYFAPSVDAAMARPIT